MKNIKKIILIASFIFVFNACSPKVQEDTILETNNETITETETEMESEKETHVETETETDTETETEKETPKETERETTEKDNQAVLTSEEKSYIDGLITKIEKFPNSTAGSGIKMHELFANMVEKDKFFNEKIESIIKFTKNNVGKIEDKENANHTLDSILYTIENYKNNPNEIKEALESSTNQTVKIDGDVTNIQKFVEAVQDSIK